MRNKKIYTKFRIDMMVWCYKAMRKRTKQLSTLLTREDWELLGSFGSGVQTYATTGGASYDDTGK